MDYGSLLENSGGFVLASMADAPRRGLALVLLFFLATSSFWALPFAIPIDGPVRFVSVVGIVAASFASWLVLSGYLHRILLHPRAPPTLEDFAGLALSGARLFAVAIAYLFPLLVVLAVFGGIGVAGILASGRSQDMIGLLSSITTLGLGVLLALIIWVVVGLAGSIGLVRSARAGGFRAGFDLPAILEHIGRIGWADYVVALVLFWGVLGCTVAGIGLLSGLPVVGGVAAVLVGPACLLFSARYLSLLFDSAPAL
ncbi:MAG: DUF4013 domain-containing protein [Methanospirillum sp.]|nr:DUF4013 domain-containing protein [Methanospirillum sp.]